MADLGALSRPAPRWAESAWDAVPVALWADSDVAWGTGASDVWRAPLEHFDGTAWATMADATAVDIDGSAPDDVWFALAVDTFYADEVPHLLRWNGQELREEILSQEWSTYRILHVRSFGPTETWIAAQGPERARIARFDGVQWSVMLEVESISWQQHWGALEGVSADDLWVAAVDGVHHFDGDAWTTPLVPGADEERFSSLAVDGGEVWVLGSRYAYRRRESRFIPEEYAHDPLSRIELTSGHVWAHDGRRAVRRSR